MAALKAAIFFGYQLNNNFGLKLRRSVQLQNLN